MKQDYAVATLIMLLGFASGGPLRAEEQDTAGARRCVTTSQIRNTRVVDDLNILFYMSGRTIYQNILPRQCNGLARENRFSYRVTTGRLCSVDTIRVLYNAGAELVPANSCRLGYFHEITEEDADFMIDNPAEDRRGTPPSEPLPPADPEDVTKDTGES